MVDTNLSNFEPALKRIYRQALLEKIVHKRRPLLALFSKWEGFGGEANLKVPIVYGDPQGVSATFARAQANASQVLSSAFALTRPSKYAIATITSEVIEASRGNDMAFLAALKAKIDGAVNALANSLETDAYRAGRGGIATYTGAPTVANPMVLTLTHIRESSCFEVGMTLESSSTDGGTARTTPARAVVAKVDRSAGTLTTDYDNSGGTTNWATGDTLRRDGDDDAVMTGLAGYLPATISGADSFFGVNRSADNRLWGYQYDADTNGTPIDEAAIVGQSLAAQEEMGPDHGLCHHVQWRQLVLRLNIKKEYVQMQAAGAQGMIASVGFRGVRIEGDYGPIDIFPSNKCQVTILWLLTRSAWTLNTLGPVTKILDLDGLNMLRQAAADGYESRWCSRGQIGCNAPGANVRVTLPTAS